jgi:hypothetical protein
VVLRAAMLYCISTNIFAVFPQMSHQWFAPVCTLQLCCLCCVCDACLDAALLQSAREPTTRSNQGDHDAVIANLHLQGHQKEAVSISGLERPAGAPMVAELNIRHLWLWQGLGLHLKAAAGRYATIRPSALPSN